MNRIPGMPFIKSEPDDFSPNGQYTDFDQNYANVQQLDHGSIDPSTLSMANGYNQQFNFNSGYNMSSSYIGEDELMASLNGNDMTDMTGMTQPIHMNYNHMSQIYSNTPDGAPIQSPFVGGFDYSQFRPMNPMSQPMSSMQGASFNQKRSSLAGQTRKVSTPMTPRTSALSGLHIGTPDMGSMQARATRAPSTGARHHKQNSMSVFDGTPGSLQSLLESPIMSPGSMVHHNSMSQAVSGKQAASLPTHGMKIETGSSGGNESQEAKKKRRRASHNAVERRRRDNINERIQDLSHLVPQHRLDDDRVRKQLMTNNPMSPVLGATGTTPPPNAATSLLVGATARRATNSVGNITLGLPLEDREKGPNKGDILNGSVSWTRDLMWALYHKYTQEDELAQYITSIGGQWPFALSEDEKRMRTEVLEAIEKNDVTSFSYSRTDGSGLRVPKHTNLAGDKLTGNNNTSLSPSSNLELSPGLHSGGSGTGSSSNAGPAQYWHSGGHAGLSLKEEDEDEFMDIQ